METTSVTLNQKKSRKLLKAANKYIASGTQTYSKQSCRYVEGVYPTFISYASGPFMIDVEGNTYIDYVCALGANLLGYSNHRVNEAVIEQVRLGTLYSLPNAKEAMLAEKINRIIPSMEMMRFVKSGSEAVSAGIKIARAYTGRDVVLSTGYHGWHDWSTPITDQRLGTPTAYDGTIYPFAYNDLSDLEAKLKAHSVACVVLDPIVFEMPEDGYFDKLIKLAHKHKALVLFDEVVTGLRWTHWSVQNTYKVKPDLTAIGKTLGNGFPIACIGGKKKYMQMLDKGCFVSSTYGGDLVGISAAIATIDVMESEAGGIKIHDSGILLQAGLNDIGLNCDGSPLRQRVNFKSVEHKALFWQECVKRGIFFGAAQHTSMAHDDTIVNKTLDVVNEAFKICKLYDDNPRVGLEGKVPQAVSTISNLRK